MTGTSGPRTLRGGLISLLAGALLVAGPACLDRRASGTVQPAAPAQVGTAAEAPAEIHLVQVRIADGRFDADRYSTQPGATRMVVTTQGGPYTLAVTPLVPARPLPADATTEIGFTAANPGEYTIRVSASAGSAERTAVLDVRPVGSR